MTQASPRTMWVGRAVLEAATPLSITSGAVSGPYDTAVMLDANGLPTLPGPSMKGAVRSQYRARYGGEASENRSEEAVFGYVDGDRGASARLQVAWGWCHDAKGIPVVGRLTPSEEAPDRFRDGELQDSLLNYLLELAVFPVVRERVRLSDKGTAERYGKFDRSVVPAGTRFTVEFSLEGTLATSEDDQIVWDRLLSIISGGLRLGGATRSGLGLVLPVGSGTAAPGLWEQVFVLDPESLPDFVSFRRNTAKRGSLDAFDPVTRDLSKVAQGGGRCIPLELEAESTWLFGSEGLSLEGGEVDRVPKSEPRISWDGEKAVVTDGLAAPLIVPGSGVKGAIRHRTVFHYRRYCLDDHQPPTDAEIDEAMALLFGREKRERGGVETGRAGLVTIDDVFKDRASPDMRAQIINHVSIDRFSGGARQGLLFDEQVLVGGRLTFNLWLAPAFDALPERLRNAFWDAVKDLKRGWLPIGAGASRGHGRFRQVEAK